MFERLSESFGSIYRKLSGKGSISESNVRDAVADVRAALIDADVHVDVVDRFVNQVLEDSIGHQVTRSLKPGEEMIGIVYRRLVDLLGGAAPAPEQLDDLQGIAQATAQEVGIKLPTVSAEP